MAGLGGAQWFGESVWLMLAVITVAIATFTAMVSVWPGARSDPHLHFEPRLSDQPVCPQIVWAALEYHAPVPHDVEAM